jgi:hypothetical protein
MGTPREVCRSAGSLWDREVQDPGPPGPQLELAALKRTSVRFSWLVERRRRSQPLVLEPAPLTVARSERHGLEARTHAPGGGVARGYHDGDGRGRRGRGRQGDLPARVHDAR